MLAMHYKVVLDDQQDMGAIRQRVADKAARYDDYPGLAFKAFVMTERGDWRLGEAARNLYGAFYLWQSGEAALDFLRGPDFAAFSQAFGRPDVKTWQVLDSLLPNGETIGSASLERRILPRDVRPVDAVGSVGGLRRLDGAPLAGFIGLDPATWEIYRLGLWPRDGAIPESDSRARRFEVLHISAPRAAPRPETSPLAVASG